MSIEYQPYHCKRVLNRADKAGPYRCSYVIFPYIGCEHGCVYCYNITGKYRYQQPNDFFRIIQIKVNAPRILRKELKNDEKGVVCIKGYQPAEKEHRIARRILEVLSARKFPVHIITKSHIMPDDLDLLSRIAENWCAVTLSISTLDEDIVNIFEPNAPSPKRRMEALGKVAEKGFITGVALAPIIPYITDSDGQLEDVISNAKDMKATYVLTSTLRLEDNCRARVIDAIKRHFPALLIKYRRLYEFGSAPDVRYSRRLKSKIRYLLGKYGLAENVPPYDAGRKPRQVSIEGY